MRLRNPDALRAYVGPEKSKRMSGRKLARYVGVHPSTIDHLLAGRMSTCTPALAADIERVLGAPPGVIFVPGKHSAAMQKAATKNVDATRRGDAA